MLQSFKALELQTGLRVYFNNYPLTICEGRDFSELRKLYRNRDADKKEEWEQEWKKRLDNWHRKKLYDGLDKVFLAYCNHSCIK